MATATTSAKMLPTTHMTPIGRAAAGAQSCRKGGQAAGNDADDGEGNGEVLKRAHAA
jgi:hypothetical protein